MQYVLLIYQGTVWARLSELSEADKRSIGAEYAEINEMPGITPGLPLGYPAMPPPSGFGRVRR
jgi:hypothetical protein